MVLDELIPMLGSQGLDTSRVAFLGWSMGGYGALLLGGRLGPARTAAICAVSPGAVAVLRRGGTRRVRRARRLRGELGVRDAGAGVDSHPGGLRRQRSVLRRDQAVHRATAQSARGRLLARRAQRGVLELAAAGRADLDGAAADGVRLWLWLAAERNASARNWRAKSQQRYARGRDHTFRLEIPLRLAAKAHPGGKRCVHITTARRPSRPSDASRGRKRGGRGDRHRHRPHGGGAGIQRHRLGCFRDRVGWPAIARAECVRPLARGLDTGILRRQRRSRCSAGTR